MPTRPKTGLLLFFSGGTAPPAQPTGLTATPITTARIDLAWTDVATNETAYKVYRSTDGVSYAQVGTDQAADTEAYSDTTADDGVPYWYKVAAVNGAGETLSAAVQTNTLLLSLVAAYDFIDSSGTVPDLTGNGHNLTNTAYAIDGIFDDAVYGVSTASPDTTNPHHLRGGTDAAFNVDTNQSFTFAFIASPRNYNVGANNLLYKSFGNVSEYAVTIDQGTFYWTMGNLDGGGSRVQIYPTIDSWWGWVRLVFCWYDAATDTIGVQADLDTAGAGDVSALTIATVANSKFCLLTKFDFANQNTDSSLHFLGYWHRLLTADEKIAMYNSGKYRAYPFTEPIADKSYKLVFDGDSLTMRRTYPLSVLRLCGRGHPYANFAVGGQRSDQILAREAATLAAYDGTCTKNFLFILAGTNDINAARSAAQIFSDLSSYCAAAKAAGFTVIISTVYKNGTFDATKETVRTTLNTSILGMGAELVDGIIDAGGDATLGTPTDKNYFTGDTVHLTAKGDAYMATLAKAVLDGLL
jgi:lysophospholipase L1-like esterase